VAARTTKLVQGGALGTPFGGQRLQGSVMATFKKAMVVSYRLSIVTTALL